MQIPNIYFPNLGLSLNIPSEAFSIFGVSVYWYGRILTSGIILGALLAMYIAKQEGLNPEWIVDFIMIDIIFALIGARIYYVLFSWDYYKVHFNEIFNLRQGGIAIYGGIIASIIVAILFTKRKKISFFKFADVATYGLLLGQAIGRYGNFFNKEAFGGYTDHLLAMAIQKAEAKPPISKDVLSHLVTFEAFGEVEFIQVHPTFFYESCWNILLLIGLLVYRKHKNKSGVIFFLYLIGYGTGRFWIEGLRTDQLLISGLGQPISQLVAILSIFLGIIGILYCRKYPER